MLLNEGEVSKEAEQFWKMSEDDKTNLEVD